MGKLADFLISLLDGKEIYHGGEAVIGELTVTLTEAMQMKGLKITFAGKAHVSWEEGSGDDKTSYWANQTFFHQEVYIVGSANNSNGMSELSAGSHTYPLNFTLPECLPSSFEDFGGYIRYYVKATIVKPWKFDHNTKKVFTVLNALDLNIISNALTASGDSRSKNVCCLCCASGPIELDFFADRTGFVPGEWITITANINNLSNRDLSKTSAVLYRKITYRAQGRTHELYRTVTKIDGPGCTAGQSISWSNKKMQIPPVPPTELRFCEILLIEYLIHFKVCTPAFSINLRGEAPIIIGTIPLRNSPDRSGLPTLSSPPSFSTLPPMSETHFDHPPPPSYAAAMEGCVNVRDNDDNEFTMGEMSYTPHYTYYDWRQSDFSNNGT